MSESEVATASSLSFRRLLLVELTVAISSLHSAHFIYLPYTISIYVTIRPVILQTMSTDYRKRPGRPRLDGDVDPKRARRREVDRVRQARSRERKRVPSFDQLRQGERVIELPFEDDRMIGTDPASGLRVDDMPDQARDTLSVRDQEQAHVADETSVYDVDNVDDVPFVVDASSQSETYSFHRSPSPSIRDELPNRPRPASGNEFWRRFEDRRADVEDTLPASPTIVQEDSDEWAGFTDVDDIRSIEDGEDGEDVVDPARAEGGDNVSNADSDAMYSATSQQTSPPVENDEEFVLEKLFEQFTVGHHGCTEDQHTCQKDRLNDRRTVGLPDLFGQTELPPVISLDHIARNEDFRYGKLGVTAEELERVFCGVNSRFDQTTEREPPYLALPDESESVGLPQIATDVDSYLGFATSLAFASQGLRWQPVPLFTQGINTDVHLETPSDARYGDDGEIRSSRAMLKDTPHIFFGRVGNADEITIHILFPHLPREEGKFVSLTKDEMATWTDKVMMPAIAAHVSESHRIQHIPSTWAAALADSKARQIERRRREGQGYASQTQIPYYLPVEALDAVWEEVLRTTEHAGLRHFREPQIFFSAKGTKLRFKSNSHFPGVQGTLEQFSAYLQSCVNMTFVDQDRFYVDIGKETCPSNPRPGTVGESAHVFLWRRCCLESYMKWQYDDKLPANNGPGQQYYPQSMLWEAGCLTSVTPKKSRLRAGGLIYSQFYGSVKELYDTMKVYVFDNPGLEELALNPGIRDGLDSYRRGRRQDVQTITAAYVHSKKRLCANLEGSVDKSFGVREEHRISWKLLGALREKVEGSLGSR